MNNPAMRSPIVGIGFAITAVLLVSVIAAAVTPGDGTGSAPLSRPVNGVVAVEPQFQNSVPIDPSMFTPIAQAHTSHNAPVVRAAVAKELNIWCVPPYPQLTRKITESALCKACAANMRVIISAIEQYNLEHTTPIPADIVAPTTALANAKYLKTVPKCPSNEVPEGYMYVTVVDPTNPNNKTTEVSCYLHNRVDDLWTDGKTGLTAVPAPLTSAVGLWNFCAPALELAINIASVLFTFWLMWLAFRIVTWPLRVLFRASRTGKD